MKYKNTIAIFLSFLVLSFAVFFLHHLFTKTSIFADGRFYFSYTRSVVLDRDLLLGNEFFKLGLLSEMPSNQFVPNFYPPGVSILWIPLFFLTFAYTNLVDFVNPSIAFDGFESIFEYSVAASSIFLGGFSLFLIYRLIRHYFSEKVGLYTASVMFLTTNLFFYIAVEPINSHAASFFVSTLFLLYFLSRKSDKMYFFILGLIGGFAGSVRTQDLLILSLPVIQVTLDNRKNLRKLISGVLLLAAGCLIGFSPQILLWRYFFNTFWYSPYFNVGFSFLDPQILFVLFNTQNGLFTLTPIIGVALVGIILGLRNRYGVNKPGTDFSIYVYALYYFLLQLYLISSWRDSQGGSYSIRMMLTTYPLLSFGLAGVIQKLLDKLGGKKTVFIFSFLTLLNFYSIVNYLLEY